MVESRSLNGPLLNFILYHRFDLVPTLQKMGLESLFDASKSDLSGFLEKGSEQKVTVERALHETTIEVNEEGSKAAAATAL